MKNTLEKLKRYEKAVISEICNNDIKQKLIDMGVIPGTEVMISNIAPFGDPIEICLRGYELSLRKSDASKIFVTIKD